MRANAYERQRVAAGIAAVVGVAAMVALGGAALAQPSGAWGNGAQGRYGPRGGMMGGYGGYGPGGGMMGGYGEGSGPGGWMQGGGGGYGPGGWMMGGGPFNRPVWSDWGGGVLNYAQASAYIVQGNAAGVADAKTNSVTYSGKEVTIDLVAVQPGHKDQTFEVHGLTDPTLIVPLGATVHLNLVNMDYGENMEHGVILTAAPPPYPYMAMMETGLGVAGIMPPIPWRSSEDATKASYASFGTTFVAREAGTYWYMCPTPDHAQEGMYGKFVVQAAAQ
jgi:rusticyanin